MVIVTSYENPDLDGVACCVGYAELLNKLGKNAKATFIGELGLEVEFVKNYTNYFPLEKHSGAYEPETEFVIVDTTDPEGIEQSIPSEKVIEVFDHREQVFYEKFINAKKKVELVGSCATLITEEFQKKTIAPTVNTAIYLFSAIISNTVNFKNLVTTQRDNDASNYLKGLTRLPIDYIKNMFDSKSKVDSNNLHYVLSNDLGTKTYGNKKIGIAQIEITDLKFKMSEWGEKLNEVLGKIKGEENLDYLFFTGIDIFEGYNIFFSENMETNDLFSKVLRIPDLKNGYQTSEILMRKQIWPKVENALNNFKKF